jgi:hypothetical protein
MSKSLRVCLIEVVRAKVKRVLINKGALKILLKFSITNILLKKDCALFKIKLI